VVLLESAAGLLESAQHDGLGRVSVPADAAVIKAMAVSGRPIELQSHHWEGDDLRSLAPLRPEYLVPIVGRSEHLRGVLVLGPKLSEEPYSSSDLRLLLSAAAQAGVALENISLAEEIAAKLQAEQLAKHELAIARAVQSKLLPSSAPVLATLQCVARCQQARQVGGDFYDFVEYGEGKIGLVLADIAGKGISAALLMANLQAQLRSHRISTPKEIAGALESVNRQFRQSIEVGGFATLFFGFYDDSTGILSYANCGHAPAVVMRADGRVLRLESTATVIGAFADWHTDLEHVRLDEGDVVVLYSDGITEAENKEGELFGEARLLEMLHGCKGLDAAHLVNAISGAALDFSQNEQLDDITLIVAKAIPVSASRITDARRQSSASA
jgi:sigma-B regulation protein RsbU (phosphoserine phosphatase)